MSYADIARTARETKTARQLAPEFIQFKEAGQEVIGKLMSIGHVTSKRNAGSYNDYVVETDNGVVHFACGAQFDEKIGTMLKVGGIYAWTFKGKRALDGGRTVNDFSLEELSGTMGPGGLGF